jgi:hypothetical protein
MSNEANKALARRWFDEVIVRGQLAAADEIYDAAHVFHDPHAPPGGWPEGPAGPRMVATVLGGAFSGWEVVVEDQIAEDDRVATRWAARALHTGPLMGLPPSGRTIHVTGVNVARIEAGRIVESWSNFDMLSLLRQVGAIPAPEPAGH